MSYQVLARKWRPQTFQQVVGQTHVLRALVNALDTDRLHHAYLFTGTRGVGKTSLARVFAKSLNCEQGVSSEPCGKCGSCIEVDEGRFVDLIEVDAASRTKVDETRELLDNVQYAATRGRYKVYLIDEVHMFSTHSFNALLKTLEEPPPHVKFLLATTDPKKLPVTILSRCLQFNLKRVAADQLQAHLAMITDAEGVKTEPEALAQLAKAADGSVRDALSLMDQAIAYGAGEVNKIDVSVMLGTIAGEEIIGFLDALANRDGGKLISLARQLAETAPDYQYVIGELLSYLRRIAVAQALGSEAGEVEDNPDITRLAAVISPEDVQLFYQIGLIGRRDLSLAPEPQAGFEMVLIRMLAFSPEDGKSISQGDTQRSRRVNSPTDDVQTSARAGDGSAENTPAQNMSPTASPPLNNDLEKVATDRAPEGSASLTSSQHRDGNFVSESSSGISAAEPQSEAPEIVVGDKLDWHALVEQLRLNGLVRELARNANLANHAGNIIELEVEPRHENLKAERLVKGLEQALAEQANLNVQIKLVVVDEGSVDTIAKRLSAEEQARQREAEEHIAEDPTVQTLQSEFGATIESVSPR